MGWRNVLKAYRSVIDPFSDIKIPLEAHDHINRKHWGRDKEGFYFYIYPGRSQINGYDVTKGFENYARCWWPVPALLVSEEVKKALA